MLLPSWETPPNLGELSGVARVEAFFKYAYYNEQLMINTFIAV